MQCFGGPHDGEHFDAPALELHFPLVDDEWQRAESEWLERHGVAHAFALAWNREWTGPESPSFPKMVYVNRRTHWEYQGVRR